MENNGEIYCLTSPSGKKYVGQCVKQLSSGKKWGYIQRWKDHIRDANTKNYCRQLNNAINKYGSENFTIEVIKECNIYKCELIVNYIIKKVKSLPDKDINDLIKNTNITDDSLRRTNFS